MLSTPDSNVVLGDEDQQKIELVNRRLSTLQREVLSATKELATLDDEIISTQKAKKYEEEQLIEVTAKVEELRREQQELVLDVNKSHKDLETHRDQHTKMNSEHNERHSGLEVRERNVLENEKAQAEKELELTISERKLESDRAEVENARNAFLDAISSVTWK